LSEKDSTPPPGTKKRENPAQANPVHQPEQTSLPPARNYFAPLRAITTDTEEAETPEAVVSEDSASKSERPPPVILTAPVKLISLKKIKNKIPSTG
jgi:hypothetical protein